MKWFNKIIKSLDIDQGLASIGTANLTSAFLGGLMWIILASLLVAKEYGEVNYYISVVFIFSSVAVLGLNTMNMTFLPKGVKEIKKQASFVSAISSLGVAVVLYMYFAYLPLSLFLIGSVFFTMSLSELLGEKLYKQYIIVLIGKKVLEVSLIIFLYFTFGKDGIIYGFAISTLLFSYKYFYSLGKSRLKINELKSRVSFMMHSSSMEFARSAAVYSDRLIIAPLFGFEILGLYQLGAHFLLLVSVIPSILFSYLLPMDASSIQKKRVKLLGLSCAVVIALTLMIVIPWFVKVFFPNFESAISAIRVISLGIIPMTVSSLITPGQLGKEESKSVFIASIIFLVVEFSFIVTLGNLMGLVGLSIALVLALSAQAGYLFVVSKTYRYLFSSGFS